MAQKFGVFYHYGLWIFDGGVTPGADPNIFLPTGSIDFDQWLDTAVSVGAKYATFTTTSVHQGFCLWPTQYAVAGYDPYSIAQSQWYIDSGSPDLVGQFVQKCRDKGLNPILAFSILDKTYELRSGTDETTDPDAYILKIQTQLTELLTSYGEIFALWFDGWKWHMGYEEIPFDVIRDFVHGISPNTIVIDNNQEHPLVNGIIEEYEVPIVGSIPPGNIRASEELDTILVGNTNNWSCLPGNDMSQTLDAEVINARISNAVNNYGVYTLNLTPCADGVVPQVQINTLLQVVVPQ